VPFATSVCANVADYGHHDILLTKTASVMLSRCLLPQVWFMHRLASSTSGKPGAINLRAATAAGADVTAPPKCRYCARRRTFDEILAALSPPPDSTPAVAA
jgi:hypothetical protein